MAYLLGELLGLLILSLLAAFVVRWSTSLVAGFKPSYLRAYWVAFFGSLLSAQLEYRLTRLTHGHQSGNELSLMLFFFLASLLIHMAVTARYIKDDSGDRLGFGRSIAVVLLEIPIGFAFALVLCIPIGLIVWAGITFGGFGESSRDFVANIPEKYRPPMLATPTPPPSPSMQRFLSVEEAKKEAVRKHPELGKAGSRFNREFLARHQRYKRELPAFFSDNSWPVYLAEEVAADGY